MPMYNCPECETKLRTAKPLEPGKKLKCPNCDTVFAPVKAEAKKSAAAAKPVAAKPVNKNLDDADDANPYGIQDDTVDAETQARRDAAFDPIADRFVRSQRGPAMAIVTKPGDWMLRMGVLTCILAVVGFLYAIWPTIFQMEAVAKDDGKKGGPSATAASSRFKVVTAEEYQRYFTYAGVFVFHFLWGAVICFGATKMLELESYGLAITAAVMSGISPGAVISGFLIWGSIAAEDYTYVGPLALPILVPGPFMTYWVISALRNETVLEGYAEEKPEDYVGL